MINVYSCVCEISSVQYFRFDLASIASVRNVYVVYCTEFIYCNLMYPCDFVPTFQLFRVDYYIMLIVPLNALKWFIQIYQRNIVQFIFYGPWENDFYFLKSQCYESLSNLRLSSL